MAYSLKADTTDALKKEPLQGAWFGYEHRPVPFEEVVKTGDAAKQDAARKHLEKAINLYDEVVKEKPNDLVAQLGRAWCIAQRANKEETIKEYRKVAEAAWAKEKDMKFAPRGFHITGETARYLVPLLDAEKDKKEIATLKERSEKVGRIPRLVTPIAVPLRHGMTAGEVVDLSARVKFDADGSGLGRSWTWVGRDAGWLVHDPKRTGKITSALQMFGGVTFWCFWEHGYQALAALDDDGDGWLRGRELEWLAIWRDLNGNGRYDLGEVNLDPNGPDFVSQTGGSNTVPSPNERQPKSDEWSVTFERELMRNFALRASAVYSKYHDTYRLVNLLRPFDTYNVKVTNTDPGPDGVRGNADDPGTLFTYYEYPTSLNGRAFEQFARVNDANADQTYKSIDISVFKRLSDHWQLLASYSGTMRDVPITVSPTSPAGSEFLGNVESGPLNPNGEINAHEHGWESSTKVSGVYQFPFQILVSGNLEERSGYFWARSVRFTGGRTIPNITVNVEPIGARQLPDSTQLDLRVEKTFSLPKQQRFAVRANVFNTLNANTTLDVTRLSGPNFLKPTVIMEPRIMEFSMTYSF